MSAADPETLAQFAAMTRNLTYAQQGAFFLNAYWREFGEDAEQIWDYSIQFAALDKNKANVTFYQQQTPPLPIVFT